MNAPTDAVPRVRLLVATAFALMLAHSLDEAFLHPEAGGRLNLAMAILAAVVVVTLLPRMRRWVRVGVFAFVGLQGVLAGLGGHVIHLVRGDAAPLDYSGILFVLGGTLLLTLGAAEARPRRRVSPAGTAPRPRLPSATPS